MPVSPWWTVRKRTNKQIVDETMLEVKQENLHIGFPYNVPYPPTNEDGSFKSVQQLVDDTRLREWEWRQADQEKVRSREEADANDPNQIAWEQEQAGSLYHRTFYDRVVDFVFPILLTLVGIGMVIFLGYNLYDMVTYILGMHS